MLNLNDIGGNMPKLKLAAYNIEWMSRLFRTKSVEPLTDVNSRPEQYGRSLSVAHVIKTIDPDILGICEGPNSAQHLENWVGEYLPDSGYSVLMADKAFLSRGQQELAFLYKANKVHLQVAHEQNARNKPFNRRFEFDTDDDKIKEVYKFYRPPLEVRVSTPAGKELAMIMQAHPKSKGIFSHVDMLNYERNSRRNRLKLFAESTWIRVRVEQWIKDGHRVIVMGDFNDGPEKDYYEYRFGKSAIELVMGSIWEPGKLLLNAVGRPEWTRWGWNPSSARFKDRFTEDYVNVLIDHILLSQDIKMLAPGFVWNPYQQKKTITDKAFKGALRNASDHFPVSVNVQIG